MTRKHGTMPSLETILGQIIFKKILDKAFTGVFTLNDTKAHGVKDVLVIVIDKKNRPHMLTTAGSIKEVFLDDGRVQYAYDFSSGGTIESGTPLPGPRNSEYETVEDGNCKWLVHSEQDGDGIWIEKTRTCIGYDNVPACPLNTTVEAGG
ncbi:MAG: hypothetical protein ABI865_07230 [Nitrosospira sp.]